METVSQVRAIDMTGYKQKENDRVIVIKDAWKQAS